MAANGEPALVASGTKPSGRAVTRSPWLIHTGVRVPGSRTPSNRGEEAVSWSDARPNSRCVPGSTRPPSWAHIVCSP